MAQGTQGHGLGHRLADRADTGNQGRVHAERFMLGVVGVSDKPPLEPLARPSQFGAGRRDQAAGATLGGGQAPAALQQGLGQLLDQGRGDIGGV